MGTTTVDVSPVKLGPDRAARPSGMARRLFRTVHLVVGLSFGLLLVFQSLSGSALVWRPELDRLMLPSLTHTTGYSASRGSLDKEGAAVKAAAPGGKVRVVRLPIVAGGTDEWNVQMPAADPASKEAGPRWTVYTSPVTGQVLGIRGRQRDVLQWLVELHHTLLFGKTGRMVQGYLALATILLALTGLWLWWPARWTSSRFRPRAAARPLHYALGFWAMGPLLILATTATYFVWRQPMQQALGVAEKAGNSKQQTGNREPHAGGHHGDDPAPAKAEPTSLDAVIAAARVAEPRARLTMLRMPEGKGGAYTVMFEAADEHYRDAPNSMTIRAGADGTARVEKVSLWRDLPPAKRFLEWFPRIHQAEFGGPGGVLVRLIWCATGFMPAVLYVSGFLMWRRRLALAR